MVRKILLDSDIIIDFLKKKPGLQGYLHSLEADFCTTQVNVFEIWSGRLEKEEVLIRDVLDSLDKFDFDERAAFIAADIRLNLRKKGDLIDFRDIFVAAICIAEGVELLTNNKKHFERMKKFGLKLI